METGRAMKQKAKLHSDIKSSKNFRKVIDFPKFPHVAIG